MTVTVHTGDYGQLGAFNLSGRPAPLSYTLTAASTPARSSELGGNRVRFTLQGDTSFTYTATTPSTAATYDFYGALSVSDRMDTSIGGDASLRC